MPDPIRKLVIDKVVSLLEAINETDHGVVPSLVERKETALSSGPDRISVIQRIEKPKNVSIQHHKKRILLVNVAFVQSYSGDDQDDQAGLWIAAIQDAIATPKDTHSLEGVTDFGDDSLVSIWLECNEIGSAINVGAPLRSRIFGQVDYELTYHTSRTNPRKI